MVVYLEMAPWDNTRSKSLHGDSVSWGTPFIMAGSSIMTLSVSLTDVPRVSVISVKEAGVIIGGSTTLNAAMSRVSAEALCGLRVRGAAALRFRYTVSSGGGTNYNYDVPFSTAFSATSPYAVIKYKGALQLSGYINRISMVGYSDDDTEQELWYWTPTGGEFKVIPGQRLEITVNYST